MHVLFFEMPSAGKLFSHAILKRSHESFMVLGWQDILMLGHLFIRAFDSWLGKMFLVINLKCKRWTYYSSVYLRNTRIGKSLLLILVIPPLNVYLESDKKDILTKLLKLPVHSFAGITNFLQWRNGLMLELELGDAGSICHTAILFNWYKY